MGNFKIFNVQHKPSLDQKNKIILFLYDHLEKYGDSKEAISKCLGFAIKDTAGSLGGFVLVYADKGKILGATIVNATGMSVYIPEHILVYIAVHKEARGKGYGKLLLKKAIELCNTDLALHVEPSNPARKLYEHLGFTNPYMEMRFKK